MTKNNEQIIIDGVDVSECEYLWKANNLHCTPNRDTCKNIHNCYYKQLKRKEQECERTKERLECFQKDYSKLYQVVENKGYIKELDQLKKELEEEKAWHKASYKISKVNSEYTAKLKQTLEEIREILELYANSKIGEKQEDGSYKLEFTFSDIATPYCINYDPKPARKALQKINEVIDEETTNRN